MLRAKVFQGGGQGPFLVVKTTPHYLRLVKDRNMDLKFGNFK